MNEYILTIDQGTSSTRTIIFDKESNVISSAQVEFKQYYPKPGWVEHDANEIWLTVLNTMSQAMINKNIDPADVKVIGITNQRETTVVWNRETGQPIYHAIVWQSRQTKEISDQLIADGYSDLVKSKTGLLIDSYFSATKIKWILDHVEGARALAEEGNLLFGTIDSWLIYKLTGGTHVTDVTNASRTMLYNIFEEHWDEELCQLLDIPMNMLPEVKDSSGHFGTTASYHFYGHEVPIGGVAGDQQAALFGQAAFEEGSVKNTYGTGSFILMNTGSKAVTSNQGLLTGIAWRIDGKTTYALEGSVFVAGSGIQWLRDGIKVIKDASETEALARSLNSNEGVYIVPAFVGLGTPYWDSEVSGAIFGLTRGTTEAHFARAMLEAITYQVNDVISVMKEESGLSLATLRVDGGAARNNFLLEFQSGITDVTVDRPINLETTALGAAYLAGLHAGIFKSLDDIKSNWKLDQTFKVEMPEAERTQNLEGWNTAIKGTRTFKR